MKKILDMGFKEIEKEDISRLKKYYEKLEGNYASSIDLLSIFSWKHSLPAYYKILGEYLWFIVYDKINSRWVSLPLIGKYEKNEIEEALKTVEDIYSRLGWSLVFTDITPWMLSFYEGYFKGRIELLNLKELEEYIYPAQEFMANLERQRERYNYHYFLTRNQVRTVNLEQKDKEDCLRLLQEAFCDYHSCEECEYGCQKDTLEHALMAMGEREVKGILIYADEQPVAYNIVSIEGKQLVFHFKKNKRGFRGLNEYIHKESMERFGLHADSINYTEDMGVEGLKQYKSNLCAHTKQPKIELRITLFE